MLPLNDSEKEAFRLIVSGGERNTVLCNAEKTLTTSCILPNEGTYKIAAFFEGEEKQKNKLEIEARSNDVVKITPNIPRARLYEEVCYKAELAVAGDKYPENFNPDNIYWKISMPKNCERIDKGKAEYALHPDYRGKYTVMATYSSNPLLPTSWSKIKGTTTIEVGDNEISRLKCPLPRLDDGSCFAYAKKKFQVQAFMLMEYIHPDKKGITDNYLIWKAIPTGTTKVRENPFKICDGLGKPGSYPLVMGFESKTNSVSLQIDQPGTYELTVQHGEQKPHKLKITIKHSKIEKWGFTDKDKLPRKYSGWKQDTYIYI